MFTSKKIALVSVINDLATDNRVKKVCFALIESQYNVVLIGRKLPDSLPLPPWPYRAIRMQMLFLQGPLFYLFFNLRLFFKLLFTKADLLYANDLDTLLPNYLVSKIKGLPLIYDSHELFCEVPELQLSPFKRNIWLWLESRIVPKLNYCITVNQSIANIFTRKYKTPFNVVRNIPETVSGFVAKSKTELGLPTDKKLIIFQGAGINIDRGAEELVDAMLSVDNALLLIIGSGDVWEELKLKVRSQKLEGKVRMIHKIPKNELMHYTFNADLGISIDKPNNPNYYNSLPNKIFDYLQAGIPILASRLPEIEKIITQYNVGDFIPDHSPAAIAHSINVFLASEKTKIYGQNALNAAGEQTWEIEKRKLIAIIKQAGRCTHAA